MIVETCINLSIKVVKIGRKLRETKASNEVLKAQMDEAIAINNDFINQRENYMMVSLDVMQRQINELSTKVLQEIEKLEAENANLKETIATLDELPKQSYDCEHFASTCSNNDLSRSVELEIHHELHESLKVNLNACQQELLNTKQNCSKVLKMDQKKMDNIKSRFNEIKINIEAANDAGSKCSMQSNCESMDIIETKEHFAVLRYFNFSLLKPRRD